MSCVRVCYTCVINNKITIYIYVHIYHMLYVRMCAIQLYNVIQSILMLSPNDVGQS
jgi:hypothetical protein